MGIGEEEKGGEGNTFHEMHNLSNSSLVGISILRIFCVGLW